MRIREIAQSRVRYGCRKIRVLLNREAWSIDFVADQLQDGTRFRALTMLDVYTREAVAIEVGQS